MLLQTEWGLAGLSICYDTYANPEIERYYAAQGAGILINPTATSRSYRDIDGDGVKDGKGWEWYYRNRLESIASRDGLAIASADLVGADGCADKDGKQPCDFPGGSVIVRGSADYSAGQNADGTLVVGTEGALSNTKDLRVSYPSTTRVANDFHPDYYAKWYAELADRQESDMSLNNRYGSADGPRVAVANVAGVWADKQANVDMMVRYAEQAAADDVDLLVFPETVLTGYDSTDPKGDADAHSVNADVNRALAASDDYMQVLLAEKVKGADGDATRAASVKVMADTAKRLGMYIVFGLPEMPDGGPIVDADGVRKVYNSAAVAFPDGYTESFQKMHRAGQEEKVWSVPGNTPLIFEMPEFTGADGGALKAGVSICRDGHFYPELGRYYAASGAELLIHPTATTGDPWYRESRIGSYTDRDGLAAVTANLWGQDGYPLDADGKPIYSVDADGDTVSSGKETKGYNYMGVGRNAFRSTSLIITAWNGKDGTPFDYATGSALDTSGTGGGATPQITKDWAFGEGLYDPDNLETRTMNLRSAGFRITNFQARLYSKMYDALAARTIDGYTPMYTAGGALDVSALAEPIMKAREVVDATDGTAPAYTKESVDALADALLTAQALADNTTFSAEQQPLVTAAKDMLDTAYDALVPVGAEPESGDGPADGKDDAEAKDPVKDPDDGATTSDRPATSDKPGADGMGSNDAATAAWDGDATQAPLSYTGSSAGAVAALALAASGAGVTLLMIRRRTQRG